MLLRHFRVYKQSYPRFGISDSGIGGSFATCRAVMPKLEYIRTWSGLLDSQLFDQPDSSLDERALAAGVSRIPLECLQ
jgi:hypothetical protein